MAAPREASEDERGDVTIKKLSRWVLGGDQVSRKLPTMILALFAANAATTCSIHPSLAIHFTANALWVESSLQTGAKWF